MAEIGKERMGGSDRESGRVGIQGLVNRGVVYHTRARQAGNQLVDVTNALGGPEGIAGAVAVVFAQGLIVAVLAPFSSGEQAAKWRDGAIGVGDGIEGAEIHEGNRFASSQAERGEIGVYAGGDWTNEGSEIGLLGGRAGGRKGGNGLEGGAKVMIQAGGISDVEEGDRELTCY